MYQMTRMHGMCLGQICKQLKICGYTHLIAPILLSFSVLISKVCNKTDEQLEVLNKCL